VLTVCDNMRSLEFTVRRVLIKLFHTYNCAIILTAVCIDVCIAACIDFCLNLTCWTIYDVRCASDSVMFIRPI